MNLFYWIIFAFLDKIFSVFKISFIFRTKSGFKSFSQPIKSQMFDSFPIFRSITLNPDELYLGFDGLHDKYSLIDVPVNKSPHYELACSISKGDNIFETDYYRRMIKGRLDTRFNLYFTARFLIQKFKENRLKILKAEYDPVKITKVGDRYYILDGKHTAALCACHEKEVNCAEIQSPYFDSYYQNIYMRMKKRKGYTLNVRFLERIYKSENEHRRNS